DGSKVVTEDEPSTLIAGFLAGYEAGEVNHLVVSKMDAVKQLFISSDGVNPYMHVTANSNNYAVTLSVSDENLKENIIYKDMDISQKIATEQIMKINPISFDWQKTTYDKGNGEQDFKVWGHVDNGVLAQDLKEINPEFVLQVENGALHVNYDSIINSLILMCQKQQKEIDDLKTRIM
ncbi:MAG: tail fiber domain-containing protein, partial [Nitrosopumilales archaeon]